MDEPDARFELLLHEMLAIQEGIRSMDHQTLQIKGWCVTVTAALAAASMTTFSKGLPLIGLAVVAAFWFVEAHFKSIQRVYIRRDQEIEASLQSAQVLDAITSSDLRIPGLASRFKNPPQVVGWRRGFKFEVQVALKEAREPLVFVLYALMMAFLLLVTVALHMVGAPWLQGQPG